MAPAQELLGQRGVEVYNPRLLVPRHSKTRTEDLFPGYLFCRLDPSSTVHWPDALWTPNVRYFLPQNAPPLPISHQALEEIRSRVGSWNNGSYLEVYQKGDRLRIKSGALKGLEAIFEGYLPAKRRCEAFLNWFGRQLLTTIDLVDVELVAESRAERPWAKAYQRIREPSVPTQDRQKPQA